MTAPPPPPPQPPPATTPPPTPTPAPPGALTASLGLRRIQGEAPGEVVYLATFREFSFWLKHEWDRGPWEWIVVEGRFPLDFGHEPTEDAAAVRLQTAIREFCPKYGKESGGLLARVRDLVGL